MESNVSSVKVDEFLRDIVYPLLKKLIQQSLEKGDTLVDTLVAPQNYGLKVDDILECGNWDLFGSAGIIRTTENNFQKFEGGIKVDISTTTQEVPLYQLKVTKEGLEKTLLKFSVEWD